MSDEVRGAGPGSRRRDGRHPQEDGDVLPRPVQNCEREAPRKCSGTVESEPNSRSEETLCPALPPLTSLASGPQLLK